MSVKVTIIDHGPIRIEGEFTVQDTQGNVYGLGGRSVISLCRCGLSGSKPFCDGGHKQAGFQSECTVRDLPPPKVKV